MSVPPLDPTAANEAALAVLFPKGGAVAPWRTTVEAMVAAVAPVIEAQVRERVVAEIEAERLERKGGHPDADIRDSYDRGVLYGLSRGAYIAGGDR